MSPRVWWRALRIRWSRRNVAPFSTDELADLIAEVRRPNGFDS